MGDMPLDIKGCYEPQGVVDEAQLRAVHRKIVLRGHTAKSSPVIRRGCYYLERRGVQKHMLCGHTSWVTAVAVLSNGDIVTASLIYSKCRNESRRVKSILLADWFSSSASSWLRSN